MYYEEKIINGRLHWRGTPTDEWTPYTTEEISERYVRLGRIGTPSSVSRVEHDAILGDREALKTALLKYADCRHGCTHCFCVAEARAALYPYLRRERLVTPSTQP